MSFEHSFARDDVSLESIPADEQQERMCMADRGPVVIMRQKSVPRCIPEHQTMPAIEPNTATSPLQGHQTVIDRWNDCQSPSVSTALESDQQTVDAHPVALPQQNKSEAGNTVILSSHPNSVDQVGNMGLSKVLVKCTTHLGEGDASTISHYRWQRCLTEDGREVFLNQDTNETWIPAKDHLGQTYYYEAQSRQSVWGLAGLHETVEIEDQQTADESSDDSWDESDTTEDVFSDQRSSPYVTETGQEAKGTTEHSTFYEASAQKSLGSINQDLWRRQHFENKSEKSKHTRRGLGTKLSKIKNKSAIASRYGCSTTHHHHHSSAEVLLSADIPDPPADPELLPDGRFVVKRISKDQISGPEHNKLTYFERRAMVNRAKLMENDRRIQKKWTSCFLILMGSKLLFYKDAKAAAPKANLPYGKPDLKLYLPQLEVDVATEEQTGRKNVLQLIERSSNGTAIFLVEVPDNALESWQAALRYAKEWVTSEQGNKLNLCNTDRPISTLVDVGVLTKLRDFFRTRPTADQLRACGILPHDPVFGSSLVQICDQENTDVPYFVVRAVRAIESRGLMHVGIYRTSGNGALVQKLRCEVNHYNYALNSEKWSVEVLTGTLKLFFRELKEPLIPCSFFDRIGQLVADSNRDSPTETIHHLRMLFSSMPQPHLRTARVLFHHLYRVMQLASINQMYSYNLAIVLGPTLMWPAEVCGEHLPFTIAVQTPVIEFLLEHCVAIFGPILPAPVSF